MIRVGIVVSAVDRNWIGGLNYLANLVNAILAAPNRKVEPVLLVSDRTPDDIVVMFPKVETIRSAIVREGTILRKVRKVFERGLGRDLIAEAFLRRHRIDVLSHSDQLGRSAGLPTIGWIADFQHLRMPQFFTPAEREARDRGFRRLAENCRIILLSSEDARKDLATFAPQAMPRARLLRFVSATGDAIEPTPASRLRDMYGLPERFIYLPNQFWAHKNHGVVVDALAIVRTRGESVSVVCTGKTDDHRTPHYFPELRQKIRDNGVEDTIRILDMVPYADVKGLFRACVAVLNPSKFEGWSTSVEEAKSLGKRVILSDIPVHREQAPDRGRFFEPDDAEALAGLLIEETRTANSLEDEQHLAQAEKLLKSRFTEFGRIYSDIVLEAARSGTSTGRIRYP